MPRRFFISRQTCELRRMNTESNHQPTTNLYALEEIRSLPLMLDDPLYRHYPAMKLGQEQAINFFGEKLAELAANLIRRKPDGQWTITAPPYYQLPAAANLLACKVQNLLRQQGMIVPLVELRLNGQHIARNQEEFNNYDNYSKNNLQQRIAERHRVQQMLDIDDEQARHFQGRSVIIINDINVTGTQQSFIQKTLDELQVNSCFWLYIFNVEKSLGARHPEVEHQINNSRINDLDSYADILADKQTRHTARCIARLFNESFNNFSYLVESLDKATCARIYQLAHNEGRYSSSLFNEKMSLLASRRPIHALSL